MYVKKIVQRVDDVLLHHMDEAVLHIHHHRYRVDLRVHQEHQHVMMEVGVLHHIHTQVVVFDHVVADHQHVEQYQMVENVQHIHHHRYRVDRHVHQEHQHVLMEVGIQHHIRIQVVVFENALVQQVEDAQQQHMDELVQHIHHHRYRVDRHVHQEHQHVMMEVGALLHIHIQVVVFENALVQRVDDVLLHHMDEAVLHIHHHRYRVDPHVHQGHQHVMMEVGALLHIHTQVVVFDHVVVDHQHVEQYQMDELVLLIV